MNNVDNCTLLKRKIQLIGLLNAMQQILDQMEICYEKSINKLTSEQIDSLKNSIKDIEESLKKIYSVRKVRDLFGEDGVIIRTLGKSYVSPEYYSEYYFDSSRGKQTRTELGECNLALKEYDSDPSKKNKIKLILEVGDILIQRKIIDLFYKNHSSYIEISSLLDSVLWHFNKELKKRNIDFNLVQELAKVKYGAKAWLREHNLPPKDKKLEFFLSENRFNELENNNENKSN